jgi:hypothetical protein
LSPGHSPPHVTIAALHSLGMTFLSWLFCVDVMPLFCVQIVNYWWQLVAQIRWRRFEDGAKIDLPRITEAIDANDWLYF